MKKTILAISLFAAALCPVGVLAQGATEAQDLGKAVKKEDIAPKVAGAIQDGVFFIEPKDGATLPAKFKMKFGVHGMVVKPAGQIEIGSGHHHVIVRPVAKGVEKKFSIPAKSVIPADETHIHYGKGQEEAELELKPGNYFLTLQFADGVHLSYGPSWARTIQVKVK